ncbi:MAG: hypothetical protein AAFX06_14675 [Planctomycetota bacterium]
MFRKRVIAAIAIGLVLFSAVAHACNIPVFRYALERWKPDAAEVLVFSRGGLSGDEAAWVKQLDERTIENGGHLNASVLRIDVASEADSERVDLWEQLPSSVKSDLPYVITRSKVGRARWINHWHGTLGQAMSLGIASSPLRDQLKDRLLAGHSIVWLIVRSKDASKTDSAKRLLEESFKTLERKVQLPEGIGLPGSELYADVPLVLQFSTLEVDREDPKERFLLGLVSGLREQAFREDEPLLVPVFGRGRALEVIPASDASPKLVEELTVFLSGACSCQVKEQNPGFDLLIESDWDGELFGDVENRPPDRSNEEGRNRDAVLVPIPPGRK